GVPYFQPASPSSLPSHHSLMLKGGFAITSSACLFAILRRHELRSEWGSLVREWAGFLPKLKSMPVFVALRRGKPRMARFIAARWWEVGLEIGTVDRRLMRRPFRARDVGD